MKIVNFSTCSSSFLRHLGSCTSVVISIPLPALVSFLYFLFVYSFPLASIAKKASEALVSLFLKGYAQRMVEKFQVSQKLKKKTDFLQCLQVARGVPSVLVELFI